MDKTVIYTDEQAQEARLQLARYEQQKAYEAAVRRHELFLVIKPVIESEAYMEVHQQLSQLREQGHEDDGFFSNGIDAIYHSMTGLGLTASQWSEPVAPVEEATNGE